MLYNFKIKFMKALSPLVSMVLVIAFGFTAMTIVLTIVNPLLDKAKDAGIVNEATQTMQLIDSAIKAVASEAEGSKRTIHIKLTEGVLRSDDSRDWVYIDYEPRTDYKVDGFSGDVQIITKPQFLEYFNKYKDGDNANDTWKLVNGTWTIDSNRFKGTGGIAYHNIGQISNGFEFTGSIVKNSEPEGQIFVVPGNPEDLVLFLPFDGNVNTTVTTAYDYSAYKNNGTLSNLTAATCFIAKACPDWVTGKFGNATKYDGIGDIVVIPNSPSTTGGPNTPLSVSLWVRFDELKTQGIIWKANPGWRIFMATNKIEFDVYPQELGNLQTPILSTDKWYYVVGTYDGNTMRLYLDGTEVASATGIGTIQHNSTTDIELGRTFTDILNGTIDEVMIWNRSLTANEIEFLYETSIKKVTAGGKEIPSISEDENVTIVLSSPGSNFFDNVKVKYGEPKIRFVVPYQNIDIENQARFGPGDHNIVIKHNGINSTSNKPLIRIEE